MLCRAEHFETTVGILPQLAVDVTHGPFRNRLYVVWTDSREGRVAIRFTYSPDAGRTWAPARMIDEDQDSSNRNSAANNFNPAIAVNEQGVVGVVWCDRRDNLDNTGFWVRFAPSVDGGVTFLGYRTPSGAHQQQVDDGRGNEPEQGRHRHEQNENGRHYGGN